MGLDLFLHKYKGKKENGCLDYEEVSREYIWDSTRFSIRKDFINEVDFSSLIADNPYMDSTTLHRPTDFYAAWEWCEGLTGEEYKYISNILKILGSDNRLYLEFSY